MSSGRRRIGLVGLDDDNVRNRGDYGCGAGSRAMTAFHGTAEILAASASAFA
jgi:hypothetical protein